MTTIGIQYLESMPADATPARVRSRLAEAFDILPISLVLLGWHLPPAIEESVAGETARRGAALYRWHPLLASDTGSDLPDGWRTVALHGGRLSGYHNLPEFTFVCPNHAGVQDWIAERLETEIQRGLYQGIFLDRMRFPSPARNFPDGFTCFCPDCRRVASDSGLELDAVRRDLEELAARPERMVDAIRELIGESGQAADGLHRFLEFRKRIVTGVVRSAAERVRSHGLSVGLDCFSPSLTRMVGQDLKELSACCEWIKIMTYPRVFGPAGLPFELLGLADALVRDGWNARAARKLLASASGLPFPKRIAELRNTGLASAAIKVEVARARTCGAKNVLAGAAVVEMKGVHESSGAQITADLQASRQADGLVLSWDLWHIPVERLAQVRQQMKTSA